MASEAAPRDPNYQPVVQGVTDDASLDPTSLRVDPTTKRLKVTATTVDLIGTQTRAVSAVTVDDTAGGTAIVAADDDLKSFIIYNNGAATIYLGPSGVTAATGLPLTAGSSFRGSNINIALYGITSAGSSNVRVMKITEE